MPRAMRLISALVLLIKATLAMSIKDVKEKGIVPTSCELRQSKYLNTLVKQDHRFTKRLVKPRLRIFSFYTAWQTLQGYEMMNMIRKGQMQGVNKRDILSQVSFITSSFEVVPCRHAFPCRFVATQPPASL